MGWFAWIINILLAKILLNFTAVQLKQIYLMSQGNWSHLLSSLISSTRKDEVRAKREPGLCNESVKRHFWFLKVHGDLIFSDHAAGLICDVNNGIKISF